MKREELVAKVAAAIQTHEGFFPGSRSYRNNSPGNLKFIGQAGAQYADAEGFAVFTDYAAGLAALRRDIEIKIFSKQLDTPSDLVHVYAPAADGNDEGKYAWAIAQALGIGVTDSLAKLVAPVMKEIRMMLVANGILWPSLQKQINQLVQWFLPYIKLSVEVRHPDFKDIPFQDYDTTNRSLRGVDMGWFDQHVTPLGAGQHIVMLLMNQKDWGGMSARGWRTDADSGAVELQVSAAEDETIGGVGVDVEPYFVNAARHEIFHALYLMTGQQDNTHYWYDRHEMVKALEEIDLSKLDRLVRRNNIGFRHFFGIDLKYGMRSQEVAFLQQAFQADQVFPLNVKPTSYFGDITAQANKEFARKYHLAPLNIIAFYSGRVVGPGTRKKLNELFS